MNNILIIYHSPEFWTRHRIFTKDDRRRTDVMGRIAVLRLFCLYISLGSNRCSGFLNLFDQKRGVNYNKRSGSQSPDWEPNCLKSLIWKMKDRYKITDEAGIYFVTSTIVEWIPVFTSKPYFEIIIKSLKYCIDNKNLNLYAFVILDNHFHLIVSGLELSNTMASLKKYTANEIVKLVIEQEKTWLLNQFVYYRKKYKITSQHQIWQEGFHPQLMQNPEMFLQKLEYIHNNPVERDYVDCPEQWRYSSARNYINNDHSIIKVDLSLLT